jgi:CheY-like chemotaxis protein
MAGLPRGSGTILVADDDAEVRDLTGRILKLAGYTVVMAADAPSTLERLAEHPEIRLVLLDLNMPGSPSCGRTLEKLRTMRSDVPVFVMTGLPENESSAALGGQPIARFLEKPFQPPELIQWIREALGEDRGL